MAQVSHALPQGLDLCQLRNQNNQMVYDEENSGSALIIFIKTINFDAV